MTCIRGDPSRASSGDSTRKGWEINRPCSFGIQFAAVAVAIGAASAGGGGGAASEDGGVGDDMDNADAEVVPLLVTWLAARR